MAKIEVVDAEAIYNSKGLRLDAAYFLSPTLHVDNQIKVTETTIRNAQVRLERLKAERERILKEKNK